MGMKIYIFKLPRFLARLLARLSGREGLSARLQMLNKRCSKER